MKKILSLILCFCVVMSLFTFVNVSANAETEGDFTYTVLKDGTVRLDKYNGSAASLEIPSEIDGKTVTAINYWFAQSSSTVSITLPDTITSIAHSAFYSTGYYRNSDNWEDGVLYIGKYLISTKDTVPENYEIKAGTRVIAEQAFYSRTNLKTITIPDSVITIGDDAFIYCKSLQTVTIPKSVTSIGTEIFESCLALSEIKVDPENKAYCDINGVLYNKAKTKLIQYPVGCKLTTVSLPNTLKYIESYAMSENTALKSIKLPESLINLGILSLSNFPSLTEIKVDANNKYYCDINGVLFSKDKTTLYKYPPKKRATSYSIPNGVKRIYVYAFTYNESLKTIKIPNTVTSIEPAAFASCTALQEINIPSSVKEIPEVAFQDCQLLNKITLSDNVTSIALGAFTDTGYYKNESNWENGVLYIGKYLIEANSGIPNNYEIKAGTRVIAEGAFSGNDSLESVTIPNGVITIDRDAFNHCVNIEKITLPDSVQNIGVRAFAYNTKLNEINIPNAVTKTGYNFIYGTAYYNNKENWENDSLYIDNCLIKVKAAKTETFEIKEGTRVIADEAFDGIDFVKKITVPKSVTSIGIAPFVYCENLAEIKVDAENKAYCDINGVLYNKNKTELIDYPNGRTETSYTLPHSVKKLGDFAFYFKEYFEVKLSNNVTSIVGMQDAMYFPPSFNDTVTLYVEKGSYAENFEKFYNLEYKNWVSPEHKFVIKNKKVATCFAKGYTGDKACSECGYIIEKGKDIAKLKLNTSAFTAKGTKRKLTVSYKKVAGAKGYQVKYKIGKKTVTKTYNSAKAAKKVFKNLKKGKYTVQFRAFTKQGKSNIYSNWTKRTVKVK